MFLTSLLSVWDIVGLDGWMKLKKKNTHTHTQNMNNNNNKNQQAVETERQIG